MATEVFTPGDEIVLPFLIVADGVIVNISDGIVTAELWKLATKLADLAVGSGIAIEQAAPQPASLGSEQVAHGLITLDEALSAQLPLGALSRLKLLFVNSAGVRMSATPVILKGVP